MTAEELKNIVEHLKLEYVDDDSRMQFYALQTWCSIAVSLEAIKDMMEREHQEWFTHKWEPGSGKLPSQQEAKAYIERLKSQQ